MIPRQLLVMTALMFALAAGMGIYLIRLQRAQTAATAESNGPEHVSPPPPSSATQAVTAWLAHDDSGSLRAQSIAVPLSPERQRHAEEVLNALLKTYAAADSPHRMAAGSQIRSVYLTDSGLAVVDVNSAFADGQTSGVLAEELTVASFVQTLSANVPGLLRVKFLVEGKERETLAGHADLTGFYLVADVARVAKQLSAE
jgi:Sporulation and spore germination